jgi:hypothetical protein
MITEAEEREIFDQAYIPEHIVSLMKGLSGGEPFLIEDFMCFFKKDWLMIIGYPLRSSYRPESLKKAVMKGLEQFRPVYGWFMAPEAPLFSPAFAATDKGIIIGYPSRPGDQASSGRF